MTRGIRLAIFSIVVVLVGAGYGRAQSPAPGDGSATSEKKAEAKTDGRAAPATIVGTWRANWTSIALPDGSRKIPLRAAR